MTSGPGKYTLIRRLLVGDALTAFNSAAGAAGTETLEHFKIVCSRIGKICFSKQSLGVAETVHEEVFEEANGHENSKFHE